MVENESQETTPSESGGSSSSAMMKEDPSAPSPPSTTTSSALLPLPPNPSYIFALSSFPPLHVFDRSTTYPALIVPVHRTAELRNRLSKLLLRRPKTRNVYGDDSKTTTTTRIMVLAQDNDTSCWEKNTLLQSLLLDDNISKSTYTIHSSYADWTVEEVLRKLLPVVEVPSAFEIIGHIAHVNLREDVLPYKYIVGKVLLDKNSPRIRTVVNKIGTIHAVYRTFGMEVIAGDESDGYSIVTVKEEGCQFDLDFQRVYWNSRLGGEHRRLVQLIRRDRNKNNPIVVVADLMAGVGPFAIPLAMMSNKQKQQQPTTTTNIQVHANDLNPDSYKYLLVNRQKNKCQDSLHSYNMDARAFCHQLQDDGIDFHHAIMNLPASAPEFLDAFRGFTGKILPRIHVYCFAPKKNENGNEEAALERCQKALGCPLFMGDESKKSDVTIRIVRDVSPNKNMLCISFTLPEQARKLARIVIIPTTNTTTTDDASEAAQQQPPLKRPKH